MSTPLFAYFAGIGTVAAALGVGFTGAVALMDVQSPPKIPAAAFGTPAPKVAEAPTPPTLPTVATFETSNPAASADAVIKSLAFAPPTSTATALQSPQKVQEERKPASEPVRRAAPRVVVEQRAIAAQPKPERKPVYVERRERITEEPRMAAYAAAPRQPDFFRALFGL